jgi:hypothetical protein
MTNKREQIIEKIMAAGFDMISACEQADQIIKEFLESGRKQTTYYCRYSKKEIVTLKREYPLNPRVKYYIECFYKDGTQILGNLDGQAVLCCKQYKRTLAYKRLAKIVKNPNWMNGKVNEARVVTEDGKVLEVIR